jgi:hypothetical protein
VFYFGAVFVIGLALARESTEHTRLQLMHMADRHKNANNNSINDGTMNSDSTKHLQAFIAAKPCDERNKRTAAGDVMLQDMIRKGVFVNQTGPNGAGKFNEDMYSIFKSLNKVCSNCQWLLLYTTVYI